MNAQAMWQRIERWSLDKLVPFANPRAHSDATLRKSQPALNNPILVDTKAGIIAGHGRLLAARKLRLKEVPVLVLNHLSETQKCESR